MPRRVSEWSTEREIRSGLGKIRCAGLLVFNIRRNRYRLIVYPVFPRRKLYIKALLTHKECNRKEWEKQWP